MDMNPGGNPNPGGEVMGGPGQGSGDVMGGSRSVSPDAMSGVTPNAGGFARLPSDYPSRESSASTSSTSTPQSTPRPAISQPKPVQPQYRKKKSFLRRLFGL